MILRVRKDENFLVVELEGQLEFETTLQFKESFTKLAEKNGNGRIIFCLEQLKFVGSSGINQFIQVLKSFNSLKEKPRYFGLSSEFEKIFRAFQTTRNPFEICADETSAKISFDAPPPVKKSPRKQRVLDEIVESVESDIK